MAAAASSPPALDGGHGRGAVPPIYVYGVSDYEQFCGSLSRRRLSGGFSVTRTKTAWRLDLTTVDDHRSMTDHFDNCRIGYHTYRLPADKRLSVVIRNVPPTVSVAAVFDELEKLQYGVTLVTRLRNRYRTPIPIVTVLLTESSTDIYALDRLSHGPVSVEPRRRPIIVQCDNCQRYNHVKQFCHLPPRCVKCAGHHHHSLCRANRETSLRCVNCDSRSHPANYKGCPHYRRMLWRCKNRTVRSVDRSGGGGRPDVTDIDVDGQHRNPQADSAISNNTTTGVDGEFAQTIVRIVSELVRKLIHHLPDVLNALNGLNEKIRNN